jgi:hypothetical protein
MKNETEGGKKSGEQKGGRKDEAGKRGINKTFR